MIEYVNKQTEILFGYFDNELIGAAIEILIPDRYKHSHKGFRSLFFAKPTERLMGAGRELYGIRKNRLEFPIEIGLNPFESMGTTMVIASIIDISERKKAAETFRLVVESSPNAMILVNSEGVITLINHQTEKLFGYNRNELIDKKLEVLIPNKHKESHPHFRNAFFQMPQTRPMGVGRDLFALKKDGKEIQVEIGLNPIEIMNEPMVLASVIDITERKLQQQTMQKKVELEIKNKELEQFTYLASHDLQEPLRTVSNYVQLFEEDYSNLLDAEAIKYLQSIKNATSRMSLLIKALLLYSQLGRNKQLKQINCKKIIEEVVADLEGVIKLSKASIHIGNMPIMYVYEVELRQLFQNLITNAIKFCKKNVEPSIQINSEESNGKWIFSVSDNGLGIAKEHFEKIFQIFQRLHHTHEYEGHGIGLANCKKIVELHQGEIWIESTINKGTTFYFTISNLQV